MMNFAIPEEYLQPHHNSDTLHAAMLDENLPYKVGEYETRLAIASLSIACRLVEKHAIPIEDAHELAGLALQEYLAATAITLDQEQLDTISLLAQSGYETLARPAMALDEDTTLLSSDSQNSGEYTDNKNN